MKTGTKIIASCLILFFSFVLISCRKEYLEYNAGMYLNGDRYNVRDKGFFSVPGTFGFVSIRMANTNKVFIYGACSDFSYKGRSAYYKELCNFKISVCIDSSQYDAGTKFYFTENNITTLDRDEVFREVFCSNEHIDEPVVQGAIETFEKYYIKEGWVLLGDYIEMGRNLPPDDLTEYAKVYYHRCATFEFYAETEDGKSLYVTDGFCKNSAIIYGVYVLFFYSAYYI